MKNQFVLTIYFLNKEKKRDFHTTTTFKNVPTRQDALETVENVIGTTVINKSGSSFYEGVTKAFYSGKQIIKDGYLI